MRTNNETTHLRVCRGRQSVHKEGTISTALRVVGDGGGGESGRVRTALGRICIHTLTLATDSGHWRAPAADPPSCECKRRVVGTSEMGQHASVVRHGDRYRRREWARSNGHQPQIFTSGGFSHSVELLTSTSDETTHCGCAGVGNRDVRKGPSARQYR